MKTAIYFVLITVLCLSSCQRTDITEIANLSEGDACGDKFEPQNNYSSNEYIINSNQAIEWFSLAKNDNDYWKIVIKPNSRGQIPSKIAYELSDVSTIEITVFNHNQLVLGPQKTQAFRNHIRETLDIKDVKNGDMLIVHMKNKGNTPTCYALSLQ